MQLDTQCSDWIKSKILGQAQFLFMAAHVIRSLIFLCPQMLLLVKLYCILAFLMSLTYLVSFVSHQLSEDLEQRVYQILCLVQIKLQQCFPNMDVFRMFLCTRFSLTLCLLAVLRQLLKLFDCVFTSAIVKGSIYH